MGLKGCLVGLVAYTMVTASAYTFEPGKSYLCTHVVDGDTAYFKGLDESVRFLIVNTAERGQEPYYSYAKEFTMKAMLGKRVVLQTDPPNQEPEMAYSQRGDRWLAIPFVNGENICKKMIEAGQSRYYNKHVESEDRNMYIKAQRKAMISNKGNWDYGHWPLPDDGGINIRVKHIFSEYKEHHSD